jgi:hypothetical protein
MKELYLKFDQIRSEAKSSYLTNFFRHVPSITTPLVEHSEESVVFLDPDGDLNRVYFGTGNPGDLERLLRKLPASLPMALDLIAKSLPDSVKHALIEAGFTLEATFGRISNYHFRDFQNPVAPTRADYEDQSDILRNIHEDFDVYVDHFPDVNELAVLISKRSVLVNRQPESDDITGYLIFEEQGARTLIRSWHSSSHDIPMGGMVLLGQFHSVMAPAHVKSTFGWVNEDNKMAIMVYRRFGYEFDGLKDFIFARGK